MPKHLFQKGHPKYGNAGFKKGNTFGTARKTKNGWKIKDTSNMSSAKKGIIPKNLKEINSNKTGVNNPNWKGDKAKHRIRLNQADRPKPEQCEICGSIGQICFDHDHYTNKFRGWICNRCNLALGLVKDNTETLLSMVEYIKKSRFIK